MTAMTLSAIASEVDGQLSGDASFVQVSTDTRNIVEGDLFVALQGENFDGNNFVDAAVSAGASAALVTRAPVCETPYLQVADSQLALGLIARANRRQFKGPLVALTGSAGKTSSKEMLASIFAQRGSVLATRGNRNNEIGVPLTLLELNSEHRAAVIEMGACRRGDIAYLCRFAEPDVVLVTNVLPVHLEGFGDLQTIADSKGEIYQAASSSAVAVINFDESFSGHFQQLAGERKIISFAVNNTAADVRATDIAYDSRGASFKLQALSDEVAIHLPLLGCHNINNALAAAAAAIAAGMNLAEIKAGLAALHAVPGRLCPVATEAGFTLIDDSYNANPEAAKAAIDVLVSLADSNCLILGYMAELGPDSRQLHCEVAHYAADAGIKQLLLLGEWAEDMAAIFGGVAKTFADVDTLNTYCLEQLNARAVLVKGSRSARMERVVEALRTMPGKGRDE